MMPDPQDDLQLPDGAGTTDPLEAGPVEQSPTEILNRMEMRIRMLESAPPESFLGPGMRDILRAALDGLAFVDDRENLARFCGRLAAFFDHADPEIRARAGDTAASFLDQAAPEVKETLVSILHEPLQRRIREESASAALDATARAAVSWFRTAFDLNRLPLMAALYTQAVKVRLASPSTPAGFRRDVLAGLSRLGEIDGGRRVFDLAANDTLRSVVDALLPALGAGLVPTLSKRALLALRLEIASPSAALLARIDPAAAAAAAASLTRDCTIQTARRVLELLPVLKPANQPEVLASALAHSDPEIRKAAAAAFARLSRTELVEALRRLLATVTDETVLLALIHVAQGAAQPEINIDLAKLAEATESAPVFAACVHALAARPTASGLPAFRIALSRSGLLRRPVHPEEVRLDAVRGLASIHGPESQRLLAEAAKDPSEKVRGAASKSTT